MTRTSLRARSLAPCAAIASAVLLAGCNTTGQGAATGGLLGAGAGAIIGSFTGSAGAGAIIGGAAGAGTGAIIGTENKRAEERERRRREYSYHRGYDGGYESGYDRGYRDAQGGSSAGRGQRSPDYSDPVYWD